ncbi:Alpha/Beta hydrolase protein [Leucosporidium creatinivorum]|uniref:Alpha/Beta hydrolase protein n=1 Tax=Leucosporidium creatinivorum TaxID=106004 RepID=A0A1Y2FJ09_9BASI|nr:Alpha/Beta hydrolase protein [Leucosporidium creatinivorum]
MAASTTSHLQETVEEPQQSLFARASGAASTAWKYRQFVPPAIKTTLQFYTVGPQQESWSIETALFCALVRHAGGLRGKDDKNTDPVKAMAASRKRLQVIESLNPKIGVCSEVFEIPVKRRGLKGLLEEVDAAENGSRAVPAEWQVHNEVRGKASDRVLLYFHGGAFTLMNPRSHRPLTLLMSKQLGVRVLSVDYRLSPEVLFPSALHDAVAAYQYLTEDLKIPASNIIVGGDSAGGNLSLALMLYIRDQKMARLGGAILLSPWSDMTASMQSWETNAALDYLSLPPPNSALSPPHLYLGEHYTTNVVHPYVSPAIADLSSLPPLLIQAGGAETLRDEITLLAQRAANAGVEVAHQIWESGIHVSQAFIKNDISPAALKEMALWAEQLKAPQAAAGNFTEVDRLLDEAWEKRRIRLEAKGVKAQEEVEEVARVPTFIFEGEKEAAPELLCRDEGHEEVKKAVEEAKKAGVQGFTTVFKARRNLEALGFLGRVRGALHL